MTVENPRRLLTALLLLVLIAVGVWKLLLSGGTPGITAKLTTASVTHPMVAPPAAVQRVLNVMAAQKYLVITQRSRGQKPRITVVDVPARYISSAVAGTLSDLSSGTDVYSYFATKRCFIHVHRAVSQAVTNFGEQYLPSGNSDLTYTYARQGAGTLVRWAIARPRGARTNIVQPSGSALIDATGRIVQATVGTVNPEHVTITYPTQAPHASVAKPVCAASVLPAEPRPAVPRPAVPRPVVPPKKG